MSKVAKAAVGLMLVTIFSKVLGLVREQFLAASYGTGLYAAAYSTANNIPVVLFSIIGSAIATSLIPMYNKLNAESGEQRALDFTNTLINIVVIISLIIAGLGMVFTKPLVKLFAAGYEGQVLLTTISFTRVLLISIVFVGLANIMTGYLQIKNSFIIPGLIGIPYSIAIIASIYFSSKYGVYILVYGTLIAILFKFLFQVPFAYKKGYRYSFKIDYKDPAMKEIIVLILPVVIGVGVNQVNAIVDKNLASTLGINVVASFSYATRLYEFVQALFITSILSVVYPKMSKLLVKDNMDAFKSSLRKTMNIIIILLVPIAVGASVLAVPIVKVLLQRGQFTYDDTIMTANILKLYTIGIIAFAVRDVMSRGFYSLHDSKTPMVNGMIAIAFNIVLNLLFIKFLGYRGLALATTISAYIGLILFYFSLKKKIGNFEQHKVFSVAIKAVMASLIMGFVAKFIFSLVSNLLGAGILNEIISLGISVGAGAIIYFIIMYILKIEELNIITDMVKSKVKLKRN